MRSHRFPGWIYLRGAEPDPRFSLANERTFLAWIRTSLALLATGLALEALGVPANPQFRGLAAVVFVVLGLIAAGQAWIGWARTERAIREGAALPGPSAAPLLAGGALLASALIGVGLLLR